MPEHGPGALPLPRRVRTMKPSQADPEFPLAPPPSSRPPHRLALGFDFGTRRIGVAIGGELTGAARPLGVLQTGSGREWIAIAALIKEWQPDVLVVGVARHPDGAPHEMTARCERFARSLHGRTGLAVACVDERYSSAVAGGGSARDQDAAAVILQQWLDEGARA
jgi:putative Holliday junction resolvase